jgi:hypothetical protein
MAIMGHPGRWLRHKEHGAIYNYNDILCENPKVEEVSEEIAFPERFIPKGQVGRAAKVNLSTDDAVVAKATPEKGTGLKVPATGGKTK